MVRYKSTIFPITIICILGVCIRIYWLPQINSRHLVRLQEVSISTGTKFVPNIANGWKDQTDTTNLSHNIPHQQQIREESIRFPVGETYLQKTSQNEWPPKGNDSLITSPNALSPTVSQLQNVSTIGRCLDEDRKHFLESACRRSPARSLDSLNGSELRALSYGIVVDLAHKTLACVPPKAGCTTWKTILVNNSVDKPFASDINLHVHDNNWIKKQGIYPLHSFNETTQRSLLADDSFFRFMVARHPLQRLYSAFTDKFVPPPDPPFDRTYGQWIRALFHPDLDVKLQPNQTDPGFTFAEFVKFMERPEGYNAHWDAVYNLCQPCIISYNTILKTETLGEDIERLVPYLSHRRGSGTWRHASGKQGYQKMSLDDRMERAYRDVPQQSLDFLSKWFEKDFSHFAYSLSRGEGTGEHLAHGHLSMACAQQDSSGSLCC